LLVSVTCCDQYLVRAFGFGAPAFLAFLAPVFAFAAILGVDARLVPATAMMALMLDALVKLLALEKIEENLFRGQSQDLGWGVVFGGQVLGQALSAAAQTVPPGRDVHSMHAYFLRPGDPKRPIVYDVDRIRDGKSFTTRRVVAIQAGEAIFNLAASFHVDEGGFDHQDEMPAAPPPESLAEHPRAKEMPFEMRLADEGDSRLVWLRARGTLGDDPALHRYLLAYVSDHSFITTALLRHGVTVFSPGMQVASLDHVMWFHRPFRADDWLLHAMESPSARGARGLVRGRVFTRDGRLVAATAQEGLIRKR
jgi:acyl-CoA thioesterase-2